MPRQKGPGYDRLAPNAFRVSREKCRLCPQPPRRLALLRTWPSRWLTFKPSELWDVSPHSRGKPAAPRASLLSKSSQVVGRALPTAGSTGSEWGQLARTPAGEEGSLPWVSSTLAVDHPTFSELNPHPLLPQTQTRVRSRLKPSSFAETSMAQEKTWFLQRTKQGPKRD